jgi:quercetin dioxygenase-like cupin family protein
MNNHKFISDMNAELTEIPEDSIISQTILKEGKLKAILFGFAPGQELSEHTAAQPAMLHFIEGEADVTLGEDSMEAKAGAWAYMPANLPHSILAKTKVVMLLVLV